MIRDFDRNETELRDLRSAVDMLDGGLRRFATGDIHNTLDHAFPLRLEGLRRDFNRGLGGMTKAIDSVLDGTQSLRSDAEILREALSNSADAKAARAEKLAKLTSAAAAGTHSAKQQTIASQHVATIAQNARFDMRRPKEAVAAALKMIAAIETAKSETDDADRMSALRAKAEEIGRELDAIGLYVDALADHVSDLTKSAEKQTAATSALHAGLDDLSKTERAGSADAITASLTLDRMSRSVADIDREASRFMKVTVVTQPPSPPSGEHRPFLRLVKS
jgi:methyl-accepting chemotaxis protein